MPESGSRFVKSRRDFVRALPVAGLIAIGARPMSLPGQEKDKKQEEHEVSTNEDLMREHGILKRVLLAYEEIIGRINAKQDFSPQVVIEEIERKTFGGDEFDIYLDKVTAIEKQLGIYDLSQFMPR